MELCELRRCSAVTSLVGCLLATGMIYQRHLAVHGRPCAVLWAPGRARARLHGGPVWPWTRPALHCITSARQNNGYRSVRCLRLCVTRPIPDQRMSHTTSYVLSLHAPRTRTCHGAEGRGSRRGVGWAAGFQIPSQTQCQSVRGLDVWLTCDGYWPPAVSPPRRASADLQLLSE